MTPATGPWRLPLAIICYGRIGWRILCASIKVLLFRRNVSGPRELLKASQHLAAFMRSMISGNAGSVWIAQREGRAKTGIDKTEPAVIKMLSLSRDKRTETLSEVLNGLHIVPVAISYELDPCDANKAAELACGPGYRKADNEDVLSIGKGIAGQKGNVHLSFGSPIKAEALTIEDVVHAIDDHMRRHYRLFENALWAWQRLSNSDEVPNVDIHLEPLRVRNSMQESMPCQRSISSLPWRCMPIRCAAPLGEI